MPEKEALQRAVSCPGHTFTKAPGANDNLPLNCADWYVAFAFCAWDGGRLPTLAEWNMAAAGGDQQRLYPWWAPGSAMVVDKTYANYGSPYSVDVRAFKKVGALPKGNGRWGHADLSRNVAEWLRDAVGHFGARDCVDCAFIEDAPLYVQAGGSLADDSLEAISTTA